jgi:hypothetical protein
MIKINQKDELEQLILQNSIPKSNGSIGFSMQNICFQQDN